MVDDMVDGQAKLVREGRGGKCFDPTNATVYISVEENREPPHAQRF